MGEIEGKVSRSRDTSDKKKGSSSKSSGQVLSSLSAADLKKAGIIALVVVLLLGLWYAYETGWICERLCRMRRRRRSNTRCTSC